ncbi:Zinc finger BED domain-containing protein RICESLEEPER 2 [Acipenser ruthenus]|uniref:Zinc finger BED domain-containing protein RICESLEEPER 2 n=1 Tax=Acipenser ruthenus TaxID=7906 RepID=A0A444UPB6_ACIRT|nr:Zinc finger BED domain-containing protein RICESLEEPER 2 [Acipenser ruthenus]
MLPSHESEEVYTGLLKNFNGKQSHVDEDVPAAKRALTEFDEWENVHAKACPSDDEVQHYTTQTLVMKNEHNLLNQWKKHNVVYPKLAMLARIVLCIPASSRSTEQNFSAVGRTIDQWRTALKPSTVDAILSLNDTF